MKNSLAPGLFVSFILLLFSGGRIEAISRTMVLAETGTIKIRTDRALESVFPGRRVTVDRWGYIYDSTTASPVESGTNPRTHVLVVNGRVRVNERAIGQAEECVVGEDLVIRAIPPDYLQAIAKLFPENHDATARAVPDPARRQIGRELETIVEALRAFDVEKASANFDENVRIGGRRVEEFGAAAAELRPFLAEARVGYIHYGLRSSGPPFPNNVTSNIAITIELDPAGPGENPVRVTSAGTLEWTWIEPRWIISDMNIRSYSVNTEELSAKYAALGALFGIQ